MLRSISLLFILVGISFGELPPRVYKRMRDEAPNVVYGTVISSNTETETTREARGVYVDDIDVSLTFVVDSIVRSDDSLSLNDTLTIRYETARPYQLVRAGKGRKRKKLHINIGWEGPSQKPVVQEGTRTIAYLEKEGAVFNPCAGGRSFSEPIE